MIEDLDASLSDMITNEANAAGFKELHGSKISFSVPDATWRAQGAPLELDVYLYRVVDNRELRSNARRPQRNADGTLTQLLFPARIECSYVVSAWAKQADADGPDKELQEHKVLSQLLYVLWRNPTIPQVYLKGLLADAEIPPPIVSAESEDMAAKPDFWNSLGTPVRPSITCRITIAMDLNLDRTSPQVAMVKTTFGSGEQMFMIGGTIRKPPPQLSPPPSTPQLGDPISGAWIRLDDSARTYLSDTQGHFVIERIAPGHHTLAVRAVGFQEGRLAIEVPDPSGAGGVYDIVLTPI